MDSAIGCSLAYAVHATGAGSRSTRFGAERRRVPDGPAPTAAVSLQAPG